MRAIAVFVGLVAVIVVAALALRDFWREPAPPATAVAPAASAPAVSSAGDAKVEKEAEKFIATLTETQSEPVDAERADHFVTKDQVISLLPDASIEVTTPEKIKSNPSLGADTPITVIREVEQVETTTPEKIIAEAGGDLDKRIRVLENDDVRDTTVRDVLERYSSNPDEPITIVKTVQYFEITTPGELARDESLKPDQDIKIITRPYSLEAATIAELLRREKDINPDSVFYVRTVRPSDKQGIWGIIQDGLVSNFAQGMAIRRGKQVDTYKIEIPRDADERLSDQSSSFLGKLIHEKARESHVYNFKNNRMGRNPDEIQPGQEIVIINFEPDELIHIYKHFVEQRG
ncbi:MAG: hypothetical protein R3286_03220 [Gammaproteobacteria bacterium]|nr:hypothetical protein [Gammaproteobacteria bacterium]